MVYCAPVFEQIPGHKDTIDGLRAAQDRERVSHAWLFAGPEGVGKRDVALAFAQRLNCTAREDQPNGDACGVCRTCRQLADGRHPDFLVVAKDGQFIKIAQVREAMKGLRFAPIDATYRIILIEDADRMHEAAANALLKTLEEPAARNIFILLTSRPAAVLATIRSRCQQVRFRALDRELVSSWLVTERGIKQDDADVIAGIAGGSLTAADQALDEQATALRNTWLGVMPELPIARPTRLLELAERLGSDKASIPAILDVLRIAFRDSMLAGAGVDETHLTFRSASERPQLSSSGAIHALKCIDEAEDALRRNINPRMLSEHLIFGIRRALIDGAQR